MGTYRWVFNQTITLMADGWEKNHDSGSYMRCRKEWKTTLLATAPWIVEAPAHTVYGAMQDAEKAYKGMVRNRAKGEAVKLPRCRKRTQISCFILGNCISKNGVYPRLLGKLKTSEPLPDKPCDSRLVRAHGRWYLSVPEKVNVAHTENQGMCAIDPGVRTFATALSHDGIYKIGDGAFSRIVRLAHHLDDLLSRASKAPCRKRKRMLQAAARMRRRIKNLVDDLHYQTIGWLFRNHQTVVFPEGNFQSACDRAKRKIGRKSVRSLMTWAFARFRDRLIHKAKVLGRNVIVVDEAFTSKTANWTGEIVQNLGGRKAIKSGGLTFDRDTNGALGILLKALADRPVSVHRYCNCNQKVT